MSKLLGTNSTGLSDEQIATLWKDKSSKIISIEYEIPKSETRVIHCGRPPAPPIRYLDLHKQEVIKHTPVLIEKTFCPLNEKSCKIGI